MGEQMKMDKATKDWIDNASYEQLLEKWRFSPVGSPWFQGEVGEYFAKVMKDRRSQPGGDDEHVRASKAIGWEGRQ